MLRKIWSGFSIVLFVLLAATTIFETVQVARMGTIQTGLASNGSYNVGIY